MRIKEDNATVQRTHTPVAMTVCEFFCFKLKCYKNLRLIFLNLSEH